MLYGNLRFRLYNLYGGRSPHPFPFSHPPSPFLLFLPYSCFHFYVPASPFSPYFFLPILILFSSPFSPFPSPINPAGESERSSLGGPGRVRPPNDFYAETKHFYACTLVRFYVLLQIFYQTPAVWGGGENNGVAPTGVGLSIAPIESPPMTKIQVPVLSSGAMS